MSSVLKTRTHAFFGHVNTDWAGLRGEERGKNCIVSSSADFLLHFSWWLPNLNLNRTRTIFMAWFQINTTRRCCWSMWSMVSTSKETKVRDQDERLRLTIDFALVELLEHVEHIGRNIAELKAAARRAGIPVVYVNDNFGKWKSDFHSVIENVRSENKPGKDQIWFRSSLYLIFFLLH